jgi:hypothetical protein
MQINTLREESSLPWSYGSWIYVVSSNSFRARCTMLYDKVCQWLAAGFWCSLWHRVSFTNKTYLHDITKLLLKVTPTKYDCVLSKHQSNHFFSRYYLNSVEPMSSRFSIGLLSRLFKSIQLKSPRNIFVSDGFVEINRLRNIVISLSNFIIDT